jgi:hypothetical protein
MLTMVVLCCLPTALSVQTLAHILFSMLYLIVLYVSVPAPEDDPFLDDLPAAEDDLLYDAPPIEDDSDVPIPAPEDDLLDAETFDPPPAPDDAPVPAPDDAPVPVPDDAANIGKYVEIHGLETDSHLNGTKGFVQGVVAGTGCLAVKIELDNVEKVVNVPRDNLRYRHAVDLATPPKDSPLPGTAYGNISRVDLLPLKTRIPFPPRTTQAAKAAFAQIYRGDCSLEFTLTSEYGRS